MNKKNKYDKLIHCIVTGKKSKEYKAKVSYYETNTAYEYASYYNIRFGNFFLYLWNDFDEYFTIPYCIYDYNKSDFSIYLKNGFDMVFTVTINSDGLCIDALELDTYNEIYNRLIQQIKIGKHV
jgi:hypothetical protein